MCKDGYGPSTLAELRAVQLERLQWTVTRAYDGNSHYRRAFDALGLKPSDIQTLSDLSRLPFTTKRDLRAAYPFGFFAVPIEQITRLHASSGTTGQAVVVGYTRDDIATWSQLVARSIRAAGGQAGMKVHVAYGYGLFTGGLGAHYGAEAAGCTVIPMSGGQTERQVQLLRDFKPEIIMVTPSYMLAILDEFRRQNIDPKSTALRIGIFGAEPWGEGVRDEIEKAFGIDACDIYGLSEMMGPGVAQEFGGTHEGPTIWEDHFLAEIIDSVTGEPMPDGEPGELVFTTLTKQAMPVLRYRTHDLTRLLPGASTPMRRMARVTGRSDDMLIIRGVNVFPSQIEALVGEVSALTPYYHLFVSRPARLDVLMVEVEARPEIAISAYPAKGTELATLIKRQTGISARVVVERPGTLNRSTGKAAHVTDLRRASDSN